MNALENIFAEIEGDFTTFLQSIIKICSDPANSNALILRNQEERQNLKFFVMTQYWRTSKTRDSFLENEYPNGQNAQDAFLFQMVGRDAEGNTGLEHYTNELSEHFFVFERNETTTPFVLADHPVLIYNRVDDGTKNYRLPLTPWLQAFLLDPKGNEGIAKKKYRNRVAVIKNDETKYVDFWNSESLNDAKRQIYVTPGYEFCFDDVLSGIL